MLSGSRKFYIWLICIVALVVFWLVLTHREQIPSIPRAGTTENFIEPNIPTISIEPTKPGQITVWQAERARHININPKTGQIEEEFGFERLLHKGPDRYIVEKPFLNGYRKDMSFFITADRATVALEKDTESPMPKQATLSGNVLICFVPAEAAGFPVSFIYLDKVDYTADESRFSSTGPVRFVSSEAVMLGKGMQLIYNNDVYRIELLKIDRLEKLHFKTATGQGLFTRSSQNAQMQDNAGKSVDSKKQPQAYKCILADEVKIETAGQIIRTDLLRINEIFPQRSSGRETQHRPESASASPNELTEEILPIPPEAPEPNEKSFNVLITCKGGITFIPADSDELQIAAVDRQNIENNQTGHFDPLDKRAQFRADVINFFTGSGNILADGPVGLHLFTSSLIADQSDASTTPMTITAERQFRYLPGENRAIFDGNCIWTMYPDGADKTSKNTLSTPRLIIDLVPDANSEAPVFSDIIAAGPSELALNTADDFSPENDSFAPVTIIAHKETRFVAAVSQAVFDGDCLATVWPQGTKGPQKYTLSAPKLTLDLTNDNGRSSLLSSLLAVGPAELVLYEDNAGWTMPLRINASKEFRYLSSQNLAVFEGDCLATISPSDADRYTLASPRLTIALNDKADSGASLLSDIVAAGPAELTFRTSKLLAAATPPAGDIKINAQEQFRYYTDSGQMIFEGNCLCRMPAKVASATVENQLATPKLTVGLAKEKSSQNAAFDMSIDHLTAIGPAKLTFHVEDVFDSQPDGKPAVITITAREKAQFWPAQNKAMFEGDSVCQMVRSSGELEYRYRLAAPRTQMTLTENTAVNGTASRAVLEQLASDGENVKLSIIRTAGGQQIGGTEIKCRQFSYTSADELFTAIGPGIIKIDNSSASTQQKSDSSLLSLESPGWMIIDNFDKLTYSAESNQLTADNETDSLMLRYVPIIDGRYQQPTEAAAGRIEAKLAQTDTERLQLLSLHASRGTRYEQPATKDKTAISFIAGEFIYDSNSSIIKGWADENYPCIINGTAGGYFELNQKTGQLKIKMTGPSSIQLNP